MSSALLKGVQEDLKNTKWRETFNTTKTYPIIDNIYGKKIKTLALAIVEKMQIYWKTSLYKTH
jgi:hypothetical protein